MKVLWVEPIVSITGNTHLVFNLFPSRPQINLSLIIFHIPNKQQKHHVFTYNNNIHFLELHTLSCSRGVEFSNNNDNIYLDNIINSKYNFNLKNL